MAIDVRRPARDSIAHRYYGSVRSVLLVRFDPGVRDRDENVRLESNPDPDLPARLRERNRGVIGASPLGGGKRAPLLGRQLETGASVLGSEARQAITSSSVDLGDAIARQPIDGLSRFLDLRPIRSTRRVNSYRLPDELELELDWRGVPFDSRLIRAMLVFHYEGTITPDAFARGLSTGEHVIPASGEHLRFIGQVDEISDTHGEGGDTVRLRARDLTALLLDAKLGPVEKAIRPGETIQQVVANLLATNPEFALLRGPLLRVRGEVPALSPERYPRLAVSPKERHRADKTGDEPYVLRGPTKGAGEESYWDAITDLAVSHGLVPTVELDTLVLLEPRTLYSETPTVLTQPGVPRFPRPGGHRERIGETSTVRRMVYGRNVLELRFHRKLGRIKAPAVRVTSFNPDATPSRRLLSVTHPPNVIASARSGAITAGRNAAGAAPQATKSSASGQNLSIEVHNVIIQGIVDETQLRRVAEQVYEAMGRQEFGVTFSTNELASYADDPDFDPNLEPDLLDLRAGDPIQILVEPAERVPGGGIFSLSELGLLVRRSRRRAEAGLPELVEIVAYLVDQGLGRLEAEQFARVLSSANIPSVFRVNTVQVSFDGGAEGTGFSISVDARDYMRVRADPDDPTQVRGFGDTLSPLPGGEVR